MPTRQQLLRTLKNEFKNHTTPAIEYHDDLSPHVAAYIWSTEPQYYMEQLARERGRLPKGRVLKGEPEELYRCHKTGYDQNGNVLTEEYWGGHPSNGYTKFFVRKDNCIRSYNIDRDGTLDELEYLEYANGKPVLYGCHSRYKSKFADSYFYDAEGKLDRIEMDLDSGYEVQQTVYTADYDVFGALDKVTRTDAVNSTFPNGQTLVVYQKTQYGIKVLTDFFTTEMTAALTEAIKQSTARYAMVAVEAAFSSDEWLPLKLHLTDGKTLAADTLLGDFIDPDTISYAEIGTPRLQEISQLLVQQATVQEKYDLPSKLLIDITKKIKQDIGTQNVWLIPTDLYDDYNETVLSLLEKIYPQKELKNKMP